ncbi:MAG: XdhC family protein [Acidobacteria bacterium]|jgi:xanthine dehydrogenase accessory factor|nr:XdhC family protein [Acidobacteriota bacterium]
MKKELEIWQFAAERLKQNESVILLVVVESKGSSPGRQGFKMAIAEDDWRGSIGGGVMEVRLVEQAKFKIYSAVRRPPSAIVEQIHQKNSINSSGMICSGKQTVVFYKLTKDDLRSVQKIIQCIKNERERYFQITSNNFRVIWKKKFDVDFRFTKSEADFLYEEKLGFKNKLFIIGGGHCALALSELMSKIDFHITLFDVRPNLNTIAKNKFAHEKHIIESYENISDFISSGANHFVVVMTLGYKSDEIVIRKLLAKNFKYFGVLGSKAKMATLLKNLRKENYSAEKLDKIHTPIGLPINSQTPEEIAVSIAAEIIAVKNGKFT